MSAPSGKLCCPCDDERIVAGCDVRRLSAADILRIIELSQIVYPDDPYDEQQLLGMHQRFPDGQFVAVTSDGRVVGMSSCLLLRAERFVLVETWNAVTGSGTLSTHNPAGDVLYGVDTMVHPAWRRNRIGTDLVLARFALARTVGVRLIRTGIRLAGYGAVRDTLTAAEYVDLVVAQRRTDPALSFMLNFGFKVRAVAEGYLENDPESAGCAAILDRDV